ncbi:MAG: hypothetical protein JST87_19485 [Bacteroidetes bacterium]|nr:hypothetical protein [Bacteroidota bacterium]
MSKLLTIIFILTITSSFGQKVYSDTAFILRDMSGGIYHAIYIDKNVKSEYYSWWTDKSFHFHNYDSLSYAESIKSIFGNSKPVFKREAINSSLPKRWLELNNYKGIFYLYSPSDYGNNSNLIITDTTIIEYFMDGPYAYVVDSCKTINENTFEFAVRSAYRTTTKYTIHMLDWEKQIAVFDNHAQGESRYTLRVGASKAKLFPMIVNYCHDQKQIEFTFDKINFLGLLKGTIKVK